MPAQPRLRELEPGQPVGGIALDHLVPELRRAAAAVRSHAPRCSPDSGAISPGGIFRETAIRSRPGGLGGGVDVPAGERRRACRRRPAIVPCIASSISALSATVRASGPNVLSPSQCSPGRLVETRPRVGFIPTSPQHAAGIRIEPPPSEPVAHGTIPAATAAAEPPEEPPGVRVRSHGLRVIPLASLAVHGKIVSSGTFVIPIGIAPGGAQPPDDLGVVALRRAVALRAARRRLAGTGSVVLDRDRHAGQRDRRVDAVGSAAASASSAIVARNAFSSRIQRLDPPQAQLDQLARMHLPERTSSASAPGPANASSSSAAATRVPSHIHDRPSPEPRARNGAGADLDAVETSEWLEAIDAVVAHDGPDRARAAPARGSSSARSTRAPARSRRLNTPYVNTIPPEREAQAPGRPGGRAPAALDHPLERDGDGRARQQAVLRARRAHRELPVAGDAVRGRLQPLLARARATSPRRRPRLLPGPLVAGQLRPRVPRGPADGGAARRLPPGGLAARRAVAPIRTRG